MHVRLCVDIVYYILYKTLMEFWWNFINSITVADVPLKRLIGTYYWKHIITDNGGRELVKFSLVMFQYFYS